MNRQASQWVFKFVLWLAIEFILTLTGIDDLADYGEFLFEHPTVVQIYSKQIVGCVTALA
jgi:hypothetical protein